MKKNNKTVALNILYIPYNIKQIKQAYISKFNNERNNQVNLIMVTNRTTNCHYLARKINKSCIMVILIVSIAFIHTQRKENLKNMKEYVNTMNFVTQKCLMKIIKF